MRKADSAEALVDPPAELELPDVPDVPPVVLSVTHAVTGMCTCSHPGRSPSNNEQASSATSRRVTAVASTLLARVIAPTPIGADRAEIAAAVMADASRERTVRQLSSRPAALPRSAGGRRRTNDRRVDAAPERRSSSSSCTLAPEVGEVSEKKASSSRPWTAEAATSGSTRSAHTEAVSCRVGPGERERTDASTSSTKMVTTIPTASHRRPPALLGLRVASAMSARA